MELSEIEKIVIETLESSGLVYRAAYIRKYGGKNLIPYPGSINVERTEQIYKKCVEEGKRWDDGMKPLEEGSYL